MVLNVCCFLITALTPPVCFPHNREIFSNPNRTVSCPAEDSSMVSTAFSIKSRILKVVKGSAWSDSSLPHQSPHTLPSPFQPEGFKQQLALGGTQPLHLQGPVYRTLTPRGPCSLLTSGSQAPQSRGPCHLLSLYPMLPLQSTSSVLNVILNCR